MMINRITVLSAILITWPCSVSWSAPIHDAVKARDMRALADLINRGAVLEERDEARMTPLMYAVRDLNPEATELLAIHGADASALVPEVAFDVEDDFVYPQGRPLIYVFYESIVRYGSRAVHASPTETPDPDLYLSRSTPVMQRVFALLQAIPGQVRDQTQARRDIETEETAERARIPESVGEFVRQAIATHYTADREALFAHERRVRGQIQEQAEDTLLALRRTAGDVALARAAMSRMGGRPVEDACPICCNPFETKELIVMTACLHSFHGRCLQTSLMSADGCPICRATIESARLERITITDADVRSVADEETREGAEPAAKRARTGAKE